MYINHKHAVKMTEFIIKSSVLGPHHISYEGAFDSLLEFLENSYDTLWHKFDKELKERDVCLSEISLYKLKSIVNTDAVQYVFEMCGARNRNSMDFKLAFAKLLRNWHKDVFTEWEYEQEQDT